MNGKIKIIGAAIVIIPFIYILVPFINASGCKYTSYFETEEVLSYGVCYRGFLKTMTLFKDSGLTVSRTMMTAYRKPFLTTISVDKEVVVPPNGVTQEVSLRALGVEYLSPTVVRYHIERSGDKFLYIVRPTEITSNVANHVYKVSLDGNISYWE